jgi:hypothetical protein
MESTCNCLMAVAQGKKAPAATGISFSVQNIVTWQNTRPGGTSSTLLRLPIFSTGPGLCWMLRCQPPCWLFAFDFDWEPTVR